MNANKLRTQLRAGGWGHLARNLPEYLRKHGVPCSRSYRGVTFMFRRGSDDTLECAAPQGILGLIADEYSYLPIEKYSFNPKAGRLTYLRFGMPDALNKRLIRHALSTGRAKADVVRRALEAYLPVVEG